MGEAKKIISIDDRVHEKVYEALYKDNLIDAREIEIEVKDGV